jgi:hypothetical protein
MGLIFGIFEILRDVSFGDYTLETHRNIDF